MIKFTCSKCAHQYQVADDYAGRKVRCKNCKTTCIVPKTDNTGCGDSLARFNSLLQEMQEYEKIAPAAEVEDK